MTIPTVGFGPPPFARPLERTTSEAPTSEATKSEVTTVLPLRTAQPDASSIATPDPTATGPSAADLTVTDLPATDLAVPDLAAVDPTLTEQMTPEQRAAKPATALREGHMRSRLALLLPAEVKTAVQAVVGELPERAEALARSVQKLGDRAERQRRCHGLPVPASLLPVVLVPLRVAQEASASGEAAYLGHPCLGNGDEEE